MRRISPALLLPLLLALPARAQTVTAPAGTYSITATAPVTITYGPGSITFTWGGPAPQPPPIPTPTPGPTPQPVPPQPPAPPQPPPDPAPIPEPGLRVLMVYTLADLAKLPPTQLQVLYDQGLRDYMSSVCTKGPDGKTPEWRVYQQGIDQANDAPTWKAAMARPRKSLPWLIVSNGTTGYEGPLPANVADTKTLVEKYAK